MKPPIPFHSWISSRTSIRKTTWLVCGKGPSLLAYREKVDLARYVPVGLNHVCREIPVFLTHITDLDVLGDLLGKSHTDPHALENSSDFLVMPYYPHIHLQPDPEQNLHTLLERTTPVSMLLRRLAKDSRLLYYRSSRSMSFPHPKGCGSVSVRVRYFSSVAVVNLLGQNGIKRIRTLGIDGGNSYAPAFADLKPLTNGRPNFDIQFAELNRAALRYSLDLAPL